MGIEYEVRERPNRGVNPADVKDKTVTATPDPVEPRDPDYKFLVIAALVITGIIVFASASK